MGTVIEKVLLRATLVFIMRDGADGPEVLLARKTRFIGKDKWNGHGGGLGHQEDARAAAVREVYEECGVIIDPNDLEEVGDIDFHNNPEDAPPFMCNVIVYRARTWEGTQADSPEMVDHTWFPISQVPYDDMLPGDKHWMPQFLKNSRMHAEVTYTARQERMTNCFIDYLPR
jgi:8-oxo-dGTP diphosphatase